MSTDAIDLILQRLGTTIDNLLPVVIEYELHATKLCLVISFVFFAIGLAGVIISFPLDRRSNFDSDAAFAFRIAGGAFIMFGLFFGLINGIDYHLWLKYPIAKAYRAILCWIGG